MAFTLLIAGDFFQLRYFDIRYKVNQVGMVSDKIINTGMKRNTGYQNNSTVLRLVRLSNSEFSIGMCAAARRILSSAPFDHPMLSASFTLVNNVKRVGFAF